MECCSSSTGVYNRCGRNDCIWVWPTSVGCLGICISNCLSKWNKPHRPLSRLLTIRTILTFSRSLRRFLRLRRLHWVIPWFFYSLWSILTFGASWLLQDCFRATLLIKSSSFGLNFHSLVALFNLLTEQFEWLNLRRLYRVPMEIEMALVVIEDCENLCSTLEFLAITIAHQK